MRSAARVFVWNGPPRSEDLVERDLLGVVPEGHNPQAVLGVPRPDELREGERDRFAE